MPNLSQRLILSGRGSIHPLIFPRVSVSALALLLGACSTMNVTLEGKDDKQIVSAVATAPTSTDIESLIAETHTAMEAACASLKSDEETFRPEAAGFIGGATETAKGIKELLDAVRSWFPENTYTATRLCK